MLRDRTVMQHSNMTPAFMDSGIQLSPVHLKYPPNKFTFDQLSNRTFHGLPGFIADSLPDRYGNQLIDIYMAEKNIPPSEVTALDRLNYVANRGMGALEYKPGESLPLQRRALDLSCLSELAEMVQMSSNKLHKKLLSIEDRAAALTVIRIGSSAGGARSKALIALSPKNRLLDGTVNHGPDYTYWLLKFDSKGNKDLDGIDPSGMPRVEYIYSIIARNCGIVMPRTKLISDGGQKHFLIERFDRVINNGRLDKLHYVSWAGMGHADRDGQNSYEQLVLTARQLGLGHDTIEQLYRRAVFNVIGRNQDDHTKNFGFLMDRSGRWSLSPAFDMTYSYDPGGRWTRNHQSYINGRNNDFTCDDLIRFGARCDITAKKCRFIIERVQEAFSGFPSLAAEYEVPPKLYKTIESNLRLNLL